MINVGSVQYKGYGECLLATNGLVAILIPCNFGIRILAYSFLEEDNVFFEQPADMIDFTTPEGWRLYGGHRLWISPENEDDYYPDNDDVEIECDPIKGELTVSQREDPLLHVEKKLMIAFSEDASIRVCHIVKNCASASRKLSLWALSDMVSGGIENIIISDESVPWGPRFSTAYWEYSDPKDARVDICKDAITIRHTSTGNKFKLGVSNTTGKYTYKIKDVLFELQCNVDEKNTYPDNGCCFETYLCDQMLEMETLSRVYCLEPGEEAQHIEKWNLRKIKNVDLKG